MSKSCRSFCCRALLYFVALIATFCFVPESQAQNNDANQNSASQTQNSAPVQSPGPAAGLSPMLPGGTGTATATAPMLPGATNGTIGPPGGDATVVTGVDVVRGVPSPANQNVTIAVLVLLGLIAVLLVRACKNSMWKMAICLIVVFLIAGVYLGQSGLLPGFWPGR